ncbi:hypothetical protein [Pectobacterium brasiliense]|uniref:hypothetical protein n=1 Tax=Pectobacterium brasiliense TaxID=180957 RepID=UPI0039874B34
MNADQWLNECLLMEGGKAVRRKDLLEVGVYRTEFLREIFPQIQRTVKIEIPMVLEGESVQHYRARVIASALQSGGTVVAAK